MANEREQQPQVYDSTLKEWIQQQPADIIPVLLPGAIYQETLNIEVIRPTFRADKVFRVLYEDEEQILHIEFESGSDNSMASRLLVYNSVLYHEHQLPVISIIVYPFRTKLAQSPLDIKTKRGNITTFNFKTLPLFTLEAEQFIQEHVSCMYPLLPTMRGTNAALIQKALDELATLYREDEIALSQQLIWMEIFLARTDTVAQPEKYKIQEKLDMYDKLWEENPKIQRIRAESEAKGEAKGRVEGKVEALQGALVTIIEVRFPALSDLAKRQVLRIQQPDALNLLLQQITISLFSSIENLLKLHYSMLYTDFPSGLPLSGGRSTMATVQREMQISLSFSSVMRISHTWVVRPRVMGTATPVSIPSRFGRRWLALISRPNAICLSASMFNTLPNEASDSASTTETPPCK